MNNRNNQQKDAIRLTNRTARALREQAKQQRTALYVLATVVAVALCAAAVILGIRRLIAVPVCVLIAMALDALILLLARGRYLSLTGQAICVEAAARQLRGESAEAQRMQTAARDLMRIKADLSADEEEEEEGDEDMRSPAPAKRTPQPAPVPRTEAADATREVKPVARRRRQARLQVLAGNDAHESAN